MVDLLSNPNNQLIRYFNRLFVWNPNKKTILLVKRALTDFITEYAPALNALTKI